MAAPLFIRTSRQASFLEIIRFWWPETGLSEGMLQLAVLNLILPRCRREKGGGCCGWHFYSLQFGGPVELCRYYPAMQQRYGADATGRILAEHGCDAAGVEEVAEALGIPVPSWLAAWKKHFPPARKASSRGLDRISQTIDEQLTEHGTPEQHPGGRDGFIAAVEAGAPEAKKMSPATLGKRILRRTYKRTPATNLRPGVRAPE